MTHLRAGILVFTVSLAAVATAVAHGRDLLPHGEFSLEDKAWTLWPGNTKTKVLVDRSTFHSTPQGARVVALDTNDRATLYAFRPVTPGRGYVLSFWYRAEDLKVSGNSLTQVAVHFAKEKGSITSAGAAHAQWYPQHAGKEWRYFEFEAIAPAESARAQFCVVLDHVKGAVHLDDVRIVEVEDIVIVTPADVPPVLDGKLDDPCWKSAAALERFYLNASGNIPARAQTTAHVTYDKTCLYIGFEAAESMISRLRTHVVDRDGPVWRDDCLDVFTTIPDGRSFQFTTNARGIRWDGERFLTVTDTPYTSDSHWNGQWRVATAQTNAAWTAEFALPLATIGFTPARGGRLLLNLTRQRHRAASENSQWNRFAGNFANRRKYAELTFGEGKSVLKRFSEALDSTPFSVTRPHERFAELLSDQPGHYLVGSWAHGHSLFSYPKEYVAKVADPWTIQRNYSREIGEAGMFGAALPAVSNTKYTRGGWDELSRRREQYGTKYWYAYCSSWHYQLAQKEGCKYFLAKTGKPARIDPVLRRISRGKTADYFAAHGEKALPFICLILGFDEPMGYAKFEAFSKTLQPGNAAVLDQVDREVKTGFGYGRYGLYDYFAPGDDTPDGPHQRIAFVKWWNHELEKECRQDVEVVRKCARGIPFIPSNFCFMYNLNFIDVAQHAAYSEVLSADPYPTATLAYYGRERALYQTGFSTKYLTDLAAGKRICIMPQGFAYQAGAPTPARVREWASQAVKNGAEILFWYTHGPFRYTCPEAYREMLRVNHIVGGMNRLAVPATRTAIFVSNSTLAANEDRAQHGWYTLYSVLGEKLKTWFHFVSDTSLALGQRKLADYRLVYATQLEYADTATAERLLAFVEQGGLLVLFDPKSLTYNTDGARLDNARKRLIGGTLGPAIPARELWVSAPAFGLKSGAALPLRAVNHQRGAGHVAAYKVAPSQDARVFATYVDGQPAAFERSVGKGQVIYFAAQPFGDSGLALEPGAWEALFTDLARQVGEPTAVPLWDFMIPAKGGEVEVHYAAPIK